jgi:hypothetical protein
MHFLKRDDFDSVKWKTKFDRIATRDAHRCVECSSSHGADYLALALKPPNVPIEELPDEMFSVMCARCVEAVKKYLSVDWSETDSKSVH